MIRPSDLIYQIPNMRGKMKEMNIVEAAPIRDQVADILRKRIISGDLANGEKLSERQISTELNISTTPVKEAFRLLQAEGLIYTLPRKGSFVSANASEHAYQVMLLRSSIDGVAAYLAAKRINEELYNTMEEPLMKSEELINKGADDGEAISYYNELFHIAIREASGNEQIIAMGNNLSSIDKSLRRLVNRDTVSVKSRHSEHKQILEFIRRGSCEEAELAMVHHIRKANMPLLNK